MKFDLILLTALVLALLGWLETLRARERALTVARKHCQRHGAQLLDETVGLTALRLRRSAHGKLTWHRRYGFEVSLHGNDRRRGHLWLAGDRVMEISSPCGTLIDGPSIDAATHKPRLPTRHH